MLLQKSSLTTLLACLIPFLFSSTVSGQQLSLKVSGDEKSGFSVNIWNGNSPIVTNTEEFSMHLFNLDLSTEAILPHWTGKEWTGDTKRITLKRDSYIQEFDAILSASVTYEIVNDNLIKKSIELFQPSMPGMYYILQEKSIPAIHPKRYVTF